MPEANRLNHTVFGGNFNYILYAQRIPLFICKRNIYISTLRHHCNNIFFLYAKKIQICKLDGIFILWEKYIVSNIYDVYLHFLVYFRQISFGYKINAAKSLVCGFFFGFFFSYVLL